MGNVGTDNRSKPTSRWRTLWEEARALAHTSQTLASSINTASEVSSSLPLVRPASREATPCRTIRVYFIKPSKYDEQGYVLRFWKGVLPNNTLTALAALNEEYNRMRATHNVFVETVLWDEIVEGAIDADDQLPLEESQVHPLERRPAPDNEAPPPLPRPLWEDGVYEPHRFRDWYFGSVIDFSNGLWCE